MKLLRYGEANREKPALLDEQGRIRDLSAHCEDFAGATIALDIIERIKRIEPNTLPIVDDSVRIGACLASVPNFFCIGLNYAKHAEETGLRIPREPIVFSKATSALAGPNDPIVIPKDSKKTDWEIELGVIIGKECDQISEEAALSAVSGYCVINDVSERHFQTERSGQWIKGKSCPSFGPIGPYIVTTDEIADPQKLDLQLSVNGKLCQKSNTDDMIFSVARIVSYMSQFMRLQVGDIIATGTPSGVGMGMDPPQFLKPGDNVQCYVEGLGEQQKDVIER